MRVASRTRVLLGICLVALFAVPAVYSQSSKGSIAGIVSDGSGAVVPGVTITAVEKNTGLTRTTVTNSAGNYAIPLIPAGTYEVSATLDGFRPVRYSDIGVNVASDVTLNITLQVGLEETVTVTAAAPLIEINRSQVSTVVNEQLVTNLPVNGRNFLDFALTTPGVVKDVRQGDLSFGGQRGTLNSLVVDGANNDNTFFGQSLGRTGSGRAPYQFSQDAVREFQINTNAYSAEYGRAGGAIINVITKSGSNELHGSGFFFKRTKGLRSIDYISEINNRPKGPYDFDQYGASLGGPIVRDKHFFFLNYDAQRNTIENPVVLNLSGTIPTDAATQAGLATLQALGGSYTRGQDQDVYLLKTDSEFGRNHLSFRYNRQKFTGTNFESSGITVAEEHSGNSLVNTDTFTANFTTPITTSVFNEVRGQYAKDSEPGLANSARPEAIVRQNGQTVLTIGRNFFSPRETTIKRNQIADTMTWVAGAHTLKGGFDYSKDDILNFFPGNFSGSYTFDSLAQFNSGVPTRYVQAFPGPGTTGATTHPNLKETALFVQDEWHVMSDLTLNLGLRYDRQGIAQPDVKNSDPQLAAAGIDTSLVPVDGNNIGPRLGFAWTPKAIPQTVFRGGYGIFYGRVPSIVIGTADSNNGINVQTITFTGTQVPTYPNTFPSLPTGVTLPKPTIFAFDPDFQNPKVQQASLGVEHGLTNDLSVGLTYQYLKGDDLTRSIDINVSNPTTATLPITGDGTATFTKYTGRPFTNFGRIILFQSSAHSKYDGLTLDLKKRFSNNWTANASYTYSKAKDDRPDATAVVPGGSDDAKYIQDPLNIAGDYAYSDNDVRHRAVLSGVWNLDYGKSFGYADAFLKGWSLSGIVTYQTGQPYSGLINTDLNTDQNSRNDRAPGFDRNTFRLPDYFSIDPRITKDISVGGGLHVQLIGEVFNATNHHNIIGVSQTYYSLVSGSLVQQANFGRPTVAADPRTIQAAVKLIY